MVDSLSREGKREELLVGPLVYGAFITYCTLIYWRYLVSLFSHHLLTFRTSSIGMTSIVILCAGDGFAGLFGYLYGRQKLPWNAEKSVVGLVSFVVASVVISLLYREIFVACGYIPALEGVATTTIISACGVAALLETMPGIGSWDNLLISVTSIYLLS